MNALHDPNATVDSGDPQVAAGLFVTRFQVEGDDEILAHPQRQRRQRLSRGEEPAACVKLWAEGKTLLNRADNPATKEGMR
jgi:hypothetical protein